MDKTIYETPAYRIGNTQWKLIVFEKDDALIHPAPDVWSISKARFTRYLWRRHSEIWQIETDHPNYNPHDGTWAGLPHRLRKIYKKHEAEIKEALSFAPLPAVPPPLQVNMFQSGEDLPLFSNCPIKADTSEYKPRFQQKQPKLPMMENRP